MVDASVATRFILKEDYAEEAERVLRIFTEGDIDLTSPPLIIYEVGNALRTAASRGIIKPADAASSFDAFLRLKLGKLILSDRQHSDALEWSIRKSVSYYDAVYILCSKASGYTLLTADNKQIEAMGREHEALHLRDF